MMQAVKRPFTSRLVIRFVIIIAIALLPAGIIAVSQTNALEKEIRARTEAALMGATFRGASAETGLIRQVMGMAASLAAAAPSVINDLPACRALMRAVAAEQPAASLVAFLPPSGMMTCSSQQRDYDFAGNPLFNRIMQSQAPLFVVNPRGPVSGTSVLGITHPVLGADGTSVGSIVISLPHDALTDIRVAATLNDGTGSAIPDEELVFWTFDREGTLLTANVELDVAARHAPAAMPLKNFVGSDSRLFQAPSVGGVTKSYVVVPIVAGELYVMSTFAQNAIAVQNGTGWSAYVPTMLMWLAGLLAAGFAAEILVARHIRTLNNAMGGFARGDRRLQALELKHAPAELDELAQAYVSMTVSITRSEAELEDSVHQKEVLLREVHHRVKNNLQLISSIMNIQIRNAKGGEAKGLLKNLQERIISLATVHRGLYQTSGLADVKARELIPDIVRQIMAISAGSDRPFATEVDIDDLRIVPDQAVPLSLLLTEAMTNAIKHAGATSVRPGKLMVRLKRSGGSDAVLEVINTKNQQSTDHAHDANINTGLGTQLITAFVQQLGGKHENIVSDQDYALKITFRLSPLAHAEERQVSHLNLEQAGNA